LYSKQGITALSFITCGGYITAAGRITGGSLTIGNTDASWKSKTVVTTVSTTSSHIFTAKNGTDYTGSLVTAVTTDTIYYLGS
jgi:hypothetical protein